MNAHRFDDPWPRLLELVRTLRGPNGCPWDREQTTGSLAPFLVEEAFEVLHAVENGRNESILEEAGDLSFVLFLFLLTAEEEGRGELAAAIDRTVTKIQDRHPHVFAKSEPHGGNERRAEGSPRHLQLEWERLKQEGADELEGDGAAGRQHRLPPPHPALPALAQSSKLQSKAANLGFDWPTVEPVFSKVREELDELAAAHRLGSEAEAREELGDLLFAVVNLSRFLRMDPEAALRRANEKFRARFHRMLARMEEDGLDAARSSLETMDRYWERAKQDEPGTRASRADQDG